MTDKHKFDDDDLAAEDSGPSKSAKKRQMHALQLLGAELVELNEEKLAGVPLTPDLAKAIAEAKRIKSHEGLRRQKQYIGKLMRAADHEAIAAYLTNLKDQQNRLARSLHLMERWRDELIDGEENKTAEFVAEFPDVDVQQLRTLIRNAKQEKLRNKPPTNSRKLFKLIRAQMAAQ